MRTFIFHFLLILALAGSVWRASAQGTTAFTYQGQLHDNGTNANGNYTMLFKLYDAAIAGNQAGINVTNSVTLANGLFTVNIDFGAGAFNGGGRWLDITVISGVVAQTLSPRVQVLPAPYAQFAALAANVTNGAITSAQISAGAVANLNLTANAVNGTNIAAGQAVKSLNGLKDAVVIAAGANVTLATNGSTLTLGGGTNYIPTFNYFATNGTFIVPAGVTRIEVEMWGGGGGGGGEYDNGAGCQTTGGGGGGGAYSKGIFNVTPGASYAVTVGGGGGAGVGNNSGGFGGNGGTSSLDALISAGGGSGAGNGPNCAGQQGCGDGGSGGSNSGNGIFMTIEGGNGLAGCDGGYAGSGALGGPGGFGRGGGSGGNPGGGGGGSDGTNGLNGGAGARGLVLIYY